jgi:hypothetical protein
MTRERARRANHWFTSPAPFAKIFRFTFDPNHFYIVRIPAQHRGAFRDRHERKVGMRWTRVARLTRALTCGWRSRVVLTPRRWRQVGESNFTNDGGKQARSPRRARRKPLKPLRAGMPGDPGATVVTNACAYYTSRTRLRVQRAPGIPRSLKGARNSSITRAQRVAGMRRRIDLRSSRIQFSFVIPRCAIAHLRMRPLGAGPESILPAGVMDSGLARKSSRPGMTAYFSLAV